MSFLPDNRLIAWGTVAAAALTTVAMGLAGVVYEVRLRDDASASLAADVDHEGRLRAIESGVSEMRADVRETKTDVAWIRRFLDRPIGVNDKPQTAGNAR